MSSVSDRVAAEVQLPPLHELGADLLQVTTAQRLMTLALPFVFMGSYALFAYLRWWPIAVFSVMALSFVTYGSTSHDLVHRALHFPHRFNDFMLSLIELLSFRSGTAYRLSHLHHHQRTLAKDDIEGLPAHGSLTGALISGIAMQPRLWLWAWKTHPEDRKKLFCEAGMIVVMLAGSVLALPWSFTPFIFAALVIAGSWLFPLITVYIPHDVNGASTLTQTRLFRGWFVRLIAFDHLYHLEHHLYPAVPHHHWKSLADRLDPYFLQTGIQPHPTRKNRIE